MPRVVASPHKLKAEKEYYLLQTTPGSTGVWVATMSAVIKTPEMEDDITGGLRKGFTIGDGQCGPRK
jgi:hypothetical protein